jgi:hypothetical protein
MTYGTYTHIKTGKKYTLMFDNIIDCTNSRSEEELLNVLYMGETGMLFTRERKEFFEKFRKDVDYYGW